MYFDLNYDDSKFRDLTIEPSEKEDPDMLHGYAQKLKITNPAVTFSKLAKAGDFNRMSDEDYELALKRIKIVCGFFGDKTNENVFHVLAEAINYILSREEDAKPAEDKAKEDEAEAEAEEEYEEEEWDLDLLSSEDDNNDDDDDV